MTITKKVYNEMIAHAKAGFPNEACGILAGAVGDSSDRTVFCHYFFPMRNMDESSISYFMDPKEQLKVFKTLREKKLEMTGIFHSHVASEAYPSQKDVRLAFYPDVSYLIVSLSDMDKPVLRAYKIVEEKVKEEGVKIIGE